MDNMCSLSCSVTFYGIEHSRNCKYRRSLTEDVIKPSPLPVSDYPSPSILGSYKKDKTFLVINKLHVPLALPESKTMSVSV
jgi:hypothetical protein